MNCSDYSTAWICRRCGLLSALGYDHQSDQEEQARQPDSFSNLITVTGPKGEYCRYCRAREPKVTEQPGIGLEGIVDQLQSHMDVVAIPFVSLSNYFPRTQVSYADLHVLSCVIIGISLFGG